MPLLIILGLLVVAAAVAIFKVNKWQADRYVKLAKKAKEAKDADDMGNAKEENQNDTDK